MSPQKPTDEVSALADNSRLREEMCRVIAERERARNALVEIQAHAEETTSAPYSSHWPAAHERLRAAWVITKCVGGLSYGD